MELTTTMEIALVTFAAVVAAQLLKGAMRMITSFVKKTPTTLDDKIWTAVVNAVNVANSAPIPNAEKYNPTSKHYTNPYGHNN